MIARHDDLRLGQRIEESACLLEFAGVRALRQVAADDHDIWLGSGNRVRQRGQSCRVGASEMQVREMSHDAQGLRPFAQANVAGSTSALSRGGTMTRRARGRMR